MRDSKGRFTKGAEEGLKVSMNVPTLTNIIYFILFICHG